MKTCQTQHSTAKTFFSRVSQFSSKDTLFLPAFVQVLERENVTLVQVMLNNYYFNFRSVGAILPDKLIEGGVSHI